MASIAVQWLHSAPPAADRQQQCGTRVTFATSIVREVFIVVPKLVALCTQTTVDQKSNAEDRDQHADCHDYHSSKISHGLDNIGSVAKCRGGNAHG